MMRLIITSPILIAIRKENRIAIRGPDRDLHAPRQIALDIIRLAVQRYGAGSVAAAVAIFERNRRLVGVEETDVDDVFGVCGMVAVALYVFLVLDDVHGAPAGSVGWGCGSRVGRHERIVNRLRLRNAVVLIGRVLLIHGQSLIVTTIRLHKDSGAEYLRAIGSPCWLFCADVAGCMGVVAFSVIH